jgi:hypothetical protein
MLSNGSVWLLAKPIIIYSEAMELGLRNNKTPISC